MGKLEVRGNASKTVDYDIMRIELEFHAKEKTSAEVSEKVMRECEEFLGVLKKRGVDISNISLIKDSVDQSVVYHGDSERDIYRAERVIEIESKFNMKIINDIRIITNNSNAQIDFNVNFELSDRDTIREELMLEALKNARKQAEVMARAVDQKIVGLVSAEKNASNPESVIEPSDLCLSFCYDEEEETYDNSNELSPSNITFTESIYTIWEIG